MNSMGAAKAVATSARLIEAGIIEASFEYNGGKVFDHEMKISEAVKLRDALDDAIKENRREGKAVQS